MAEWKEKMMANKIRMPKADGTFISYQIKGPKTFDIPKKQFESRKVYSAAHVVSDPLKTTNPNGGPAIDWEATLDYRRYLWSLGLGVAEAMDTAQRGMGLDWEMTKELIKRTLKEAKISGGDVASGAGTDQLEPGPDVKLQDVVDAYLEQCEYIENLDGKIILMASRALAACAQNPEDYMYVYDQILNQVKKPVIIHWLGEMFDPSLAGYWGYKDIDKAMEVCLGMITKHTNKIEGIKVSLLDDEKEIIMRRSLPEVVRMYTGDDFNYPRLILGDDDKYSDALLGIFDAIAPAASAAMHALDQGDTQLYKEILEPTVPLSRHIFEKPTYNYKTGVVFMAYLNGHQNHFHMVNGMENNRSVIHLSELFILADQAGLLLNPDLAAQRMKSVLAVAGVSQ